MSHWAVKSTFWSFAGITSCSGSDALHESSDSKAMKMKIFFMLVSDIKSVSLIRVKYTITKIKAISNHENMPLNSVNLLKLPRM